MGQIPNGSDHTYPLGVGTLELTGHVRALFSCLECTWQREQSNFLIIFSWDVPWQRSTANSKFPFGIALWTLLFDARTVPPLYISIYIYIYYIYIYIYIYIIYIYIYIYIHTHTHHSFIHSYIHIFIIFLILVFSKNAQTMPSLCHHRNNYILKYINIEVI